MRPHHCGPRPLGPAWGIATGARGCGTVRHGWYSPAAGARRTHAGARRRAAHGLGGALLDGGPSRGADSQLRGCASTGSDLVGRRGAGRLQPLLPRSDGAGRGVRGHSDRDRGHAGPDGTRHASGLPDVGRGDRRRCGRSDSAGRRSDGRGCGVSRPICGRRLLGSRCIRQLCHLHHRRARGGRSLS